mgnify:CR=1 FL=1
MTDEPTVPGDDAPHLLVVDDDTRTRAHQAWRHGQVLCVTHPPGPEGRLSLAVPGRDLTAGRALDALARLRPLNPYGWSKHLFDRRVASMIAEDGPAPPQTRQLDQQAPHRPASSSSASAVRERK